jgi:uncharacterized protein YdbL (DUF1318 family)
MRFILAGMTVAALLVAAGCVIRTQHQIDAHIVVDIRHIEEQAENVLDYVEGKTETLPQAPTTEKKGSSFLEHAIDFVSPIRVAYAAELQQSSPVVTELAKKMKERHQQLEEIKKKNCLGEDNRGYVAVRECDYCSDAEKKNEVQKLCAAENADRKALYKEIAQLNKDQNVTVTQIERIFAQKRLERAAAGEIFQLPSAGADFDSFKASAAGAKLGAECKADSWVTIK